MRSRKGTLKAAAEENPQPATHENHPSKKSTSQQPPRIFNSMLNNSTSSSDHHHGKYAQIPCSLKDKMSPYINTPYVLQGIYYFLRHSLLWKASLCPIFWTLVFVVCAFLILLPLAFIPQGIALSTIMTPFLGFPLALICALMELLVVIMIFSAIVLLPITDKLFDQVLVLRGHGALVETDNGMSCCGCCSIVSVMSLVISICTLPINLIPVAGTALWLFVNGRLYTWDKFSHYHYELKGRKFKEQRAFVRSRWYAHHMFGMQAMGLELIPFVNVFFVFTNTVGAAMWAADMEDQLLLQKQSYDDEVNKNETTDETGLVVVDPINNNDYLKASYPTEESMLQAEIKSEAYGA